MNHRWLEIDGPWMKSRVAVYECETCGDRRIILAAIHGALLQPPLVEGCPGPRPEANSDPAHDSRN